MWAHFYIWSVLFPAFFTECAFLKPRETVISPVLCLFPFPTCQHQFIQQTFCKGLLWAKIQSQIRYQPCFQGTHSLAEEIEKADGYTHWGGYWNGGRGVTGQQPEPCAVSPLKQHRHNSWGGLIDCRYWRNREKTKIAQFKSVCPCPHASLYKQQPPCLPCPS